MTVTVMLRPFYYSSVRVRSDQLARSQVCGGEQALQLQLNAIRHALRRKESGAA
jgi:hypothetical protein